MNTKEIKINLDLWRQISFYKKKKLEGGVFGIKSIKEEIKNLKDRIKNKLKIIDNRLWNLNRYLSEL